MFDNIIGILIGLGAVAIIYFIVFFIAKYSTEKYIKNKDKDQMKIDTSATLEDTSTEIKTATDTPEFDPNKEYCVIEEKEYGFVSFFYGITIWMKKEFDSYFLATYFDFSLKIKLPSLEEFDGEMPFDQLEMIRKWSDIHKDELVSNLEKIQKDEEPQEIDPLE